MKEHNSIECPDCLHVGRYQGTVTGDLGDREYSINECPACGTRWRKPRRPGARVRD